MSSLPPANPATPPTATPATRAPSDATKATDKDNRAPNSRREKTSLPSGSVPSGNHGPRDSSIEASTPSRSHRIDTSPPVASNPRCSRARPFKSPPESIDELQGSDKRPHDPPVGRDDARTHRRSILVVGELALRIVGRQEGREQRRQDQACQQRRTNRTRP